MSNEALSAAQIFLSIPILKRQAFGKLTMAKLPPIQTPIERRWREFRIEYLPFVAFSVSVVAAAILWGEFALPHKCEVPSTESTSLPPVLQTTEGTMATVARAASGGIAATNSASGYSSSGYSD